MLIDKVLIEYGVFCAPECIDFYWPAYQDQVEISIMMQVINCLSGMKLIIVLIFHNFLYNGMLIAM